MANTMIQMKPTAESNDSISATKSLAFDRATIAERIDKTTVTGMLIGRR